MMKYLLLTVAFVSLFYYSASLLTCYDCPLDNTCETQKNCSAGEDSCIKIKLSEKTNIFRCWKYSECNPDKIEEKIRVGTFNFSCCKSNLCNNGPRTVVGSEITFSIAFILTAGTFLLS